MKQELIIKAVGKKSKGTVKTHVKRSSKGKLVKVKEHTRSQKDRVAQEKIDELKSQQKAKKKTANTKEEWKEKINETVMNGTSINRSQNCSNFEAVSAPNTIKPFLPTSNLNNGVTSYNLEFKNNRSYKGQTNIKNIIIFC